MRGVALWVGLMVLLQPLRGPDPAQDHEDDSARKERDDEPGNPTDEEPCEPGHFEAAGHVKEPRGRDPNDARRLTPPAGHRERAAHVRRDRLNPAPARGGCWRRLKSY